MTDEMDPDRRLPDEVLLALADGDDDPALDAARETLAASPADRQALAELLALEAALAGEPLSRAEASPREDEAPLPAELEATLLAIPGAARGGLRALPSLPRAPTHTSAARRWWGGAVALAAGLAMAVGLSTVLREHTDPAAQSRWKGGTTEAPAGPPLILLVQRPGEASTTEALLTPVGDGHYQTRVPANTQIQLRVNPPPSAGPDDRFTARLTVLHLHADGGESPLGTEPFTTVGRGSDRAIPLGQTINVSALAAAGFTPGSALRLRVDVGGASLVLDAEITPTP